MDYEREWPSILKIDQEFLRIPALVNLTVFKSSTRTVTRRIKVHWRERETEALMDSLRSVMEGKCIARLGRGVCESRRSSGRLFRVNYKRNTHKKKQSHRIRERAEVRLHACLLLFLCVCVILLRVPVYS